MFRMLVLVLALLACIAGLLVGTLNPDPVSLDFMLVELAPPAGAALLCAFALGVGCGLLLAGMLFWLPARIRRSAQPPTQDKTSMRAE